VGRRRFEVHHYRQVLVQLRQCDTDREIARARLIGRPKAAAFRALARRLGWLEPAAGLPDDAAIAADLGQARRARSTISRVEHLLLLLYVQELRNHGLLEQQGRPSGRRRGRPPRRPHVGCGLQRPRRIAWQPMTIWSASPRRR
jgi:hypothetical protein